MLVPEPAVELDDDRPGERLRAPRPRRAARRRGGHLASAGRCCPRGWSPSRWSAAGRGSWLNTRDRELGDPRRAHLVRGGPQAVAWSWRPPYDAGMARDPGEVRPPDGPARPAPRASPQRATSPPTAPPWRTTSSTSSTRSGWDPASVVTSYAALRRRAADGARSTRRWRRTASGCCCRSRCRTSTSTGTTPPTPPASPSGRMPSPAPTSCSRPAWPSTAAGTRMGQGGGCYDRALPRRRAAARRSSSLLHPGELRRRGRASRCRARRTTSRSTRSSPPTG